MKLKVKDITLVEYANLQDKSNYDYYLKYAKLEPKDLFKLGDFMDWEFGFVKDIQEYFNYSGMNWEAFLNEISKKINKPVKKLAEKSIFELHQVRLFLLESIKKLNKLESENLGHNPTPEEQQAGIEIFNKYRSFLQFDKLTGGDLIKIDSIRKLPYSICFAKLMLDADRSEFETALFKIRNKKK